MHLRELYSLEIEGIMDTINDYTVENFIRSYIRQLKELHYPEDKDLIIEIIGRLVSWYERSIDSILQSRFIINKKEHQKSFRLLTEFRDRLN